MKLVVTLAALLVALAEAAVRGSGLLAVVVVSAAFLLYGLAKSSAARLDSLNDVPNALRVLLGCLSAYVLTLRLAIFAVPLAAFLFASGILLNDEYQRRALASLRARRRGGSVVLLGIDGSGKSTHSARLEKWFISRGYYCSLVPFHRYFFVERLSRRSKGDPGSLGSKRGGNPLRPVLSVADNLLMAIWTSFGKGLEGRAVVYDRYIWSTYVKYEGLGYPVRPLRWAYFLPRPKFAVVLDVPVEKSLGVIDSREEHIRYRREVLDSERRQYLDLAARRGLPVIDATKDFESVQSRLEAMLGTVFPVVGEGK